VAALRLGLDLSLCVIDTAEMYADGGAEQVVGAAIAARQDFYLVSKVYPHNASRKGVVAACDRSLGRLGLERIDLYLLHWRGGVPLQETVAGFEQLRVSGKIGGWGVSNFDTDDMRELALVENGGKCLVNQILYNPQARGPEFDLLPYCRDAGIAIMAYSPLGQGGALLRTPALKSVAERYGVSVSQVALAWALRDGGAIAIPKASDPAHVRDNAAARDLTLDDRDYAVIDAAFPRPRRKQKLAMI
jgi:diketogulonate reductase-like aldo/keto reductase